MMKEMKDGDGEQRGDSEQRGGQVNWSECTVFQLVIAVDRVWRIDMYECASKKVCMLCCLCHDPPADRICSQRRLTTVLRSGLVVGNRSQVWRRLTLR